MPISTTCACGKTLKVKDELAGRKVKCPACGNSLVVPNSTVDDDSQVDQWDDEDNEAALPPVRRSSPKGSSKTNAAGRGRSQKRGKQARGPSGMMLGIAVGGGMLVLGLVGLVAWLVWPTKQTDTVATYPTAISGGNPAAANGQSDARPNPALKVAKGKQQVLTLNAPTGRLAFSSDWTRLATASGGVSIWDAMTGQEVLTQELAALKGISNVSLAAYSSDGKRLATAIEDQRIKIVKIWDTSSGQELLTLKHHERFIDMAFSPDGSRLVTASGHLAGCTLIIWDAASGQELIKLKGPMNAFLTVAYSPDGKQLATAGNVTSTVKIWDAANGQELLALKGHLEAANVRSGLGVQDLDYSKDGKRLASAGSDRTVKVWDTSSGQELLTFKGHTEWVCCVAFSTDGKQLASAAGFGDKILKLWDSTNGKVLQSVDHLGSVRDVAYSPQGKRLATIGEDGLVRIWDF